MSKGMEPASDSRANGLILMGAALGAALLLRSTTRPRYSFRNKSVVVTGGSRGLGLEIARRFAAEGAAITLLARTEATLAIAKLELEDLGASVLTVACDVRDPEQVGDAIRRVIDHFGQLDVVVNNAGIIRVGPFENMTFEDYEDAMATHAWGSLFTCLAALPHMRARGEGRIVNVASIGGKLGVPHLVPYAMSKFALAGMSEALGSEVAQDGVLFTTVFPGLMRTGSHVNASFKGRHRSEFAWFSIAGSSPLLSMSARRAARQIVEASRRGQAELVLTPQGRLANLARALLPEVVIRAVRATAAFLPAADPRSLNQAHSGWASRSRWSPSWLTTLADGAIQRNNEGAVAKD